MDDGSGGAFQSGSSTTLSSTAVSAVNDSAVSSIAAFAVLADASSNSSLSLTFIPAAFALPFFVFGFTNVFFVLPAAALLPASATAPAAAARTAASLLRSGGSMNSVRPIRFQRWGCIQWFRNWERWQWKHSLRRR